MGEIIASHTDLSLTLKTVPTGVIGYNWGNRKGTPVLVQKPSDDTFLRTIQQKVIEIVCCLVLNGRWTSRGRA